MLRSVRMMPDGTLEILGRIDTQIKLRGVRIESEGISAVVRRAAADFPGLKTQLDASTVLAKHPVLQTDQLVSFVAWDTSVSVTHQRMQKLHVLPSAPRGLFRAPYTVGLKPTQLSSLLIRGPQNKLINYQIKTLNEYLNFRILSN